MVSNLLTGNAAAAWGARLAEVNYVPAFPITPQTEIIETLSALHRAGFRHEDPHLENYLYDGDEVFVLDVKGKPRLGKISDYYDFMLLDDRTRGAFDAYLDFPGDDWSYRIAAAYGRYRLWRNRTKEWVRCTILRRPPRR